MIFWKKLIAVVALSAMLALSYTGFAISAITQDEVAKLGGPVLTEFGAERAGNEDGTIPEYTGGLTKAPAGYTAGSGIWIDPFAEEKPLFSIDAKNMAQYAGKLTEGTQGMMKMYPSFRIDIYKTHRTVAYPKFVLDGTKKIAMTATTYKGGDSLKGAHMGIPFPIPKDGYEIMWNHLLRYEGRSTRMYINTYTVDSAGRPSLAGSGPCWQDFPYYDPNMNDPEFFYQIRCAYTAPARMAGEVLQFQDPLNPAEKGRKSYQYLPGLRRVKLAPDFSFDTPNPHGGGTITLDDLWSFCGSMERYTWKFIGKKEMYVPYNAYKVNLVSAQELFGPKHLNPDFIRWELHRVWVVEAKLKPTARHIYHKRRFYIDEDSWAAVATENYDASGQLYKWGVLFENPLYEYPAPLASVQAFYDLIAGNYVVNPWLGKSGKNQGYFKVTPTEPDSFWTPQGMITSSFR